MGPVDLGVRVEYEFEYKGFVISYEDFVKSKLDMEKYERYLRY